MKINNLVWLPSIVVATLLGLNGSVVQGQPPTSPQSPVSNVEARRLEARQTVINFEKQVSNLKDDTKKRQLIRDFYSNLKDSQTKIEAISAIYARYVHVIPSSMGVELVTPLLKDEDRDVRWSAARAMGWLITVAQKKIGGSASQLLALLQDPDKMIREEVLSAMGRSGEDEFFAPLKASLADPNAEVRQEAVRALGAWLFAQQQQLQKLAPPATDKPASQG
ncbi:MAG: HEAT repeat domain-containing protein [Abitibacteriaceae bacterium]|nr:HEAT repeat domain-containing protein [Abditibacteriaceae bacterium]MBV9863910.1 HEAT repeat domain-containing protein [Abditibacteriaceae bacterium]